ncbi:26S proteasome non-ATPase regulatory subunit 13 [Nymphon striatum]|nr:26S proteasome non-ATPase regulatory subunit 13 [Nymphon striatum]
MTRDLARDVVAYLSKQQTSSDAELAQTWAKLEELYTKKLWHQLTLSLTDFVKHPYFKGENTLIDLYHNFLADFENKINALSLVEITADIIEQFKESTEAIEFVEKIKEKIKACNEAFILCNTFIGQLKLKLNKLDEVKKLIEETETILEDLSGITTVHGRFYQLCSDYHRVMGNHAEFYKNALRFLGCIEMEIIPADERLSRAVSLSLAALLGDGVYNFGELVDLEYNQLKLKAKDFSIMAFKREANKRQLTFQEIAKETGLPENEVELLVMKALSLGLVKGLIDQVDQKVQITWVQPRVLDKQQISSMLGKLDSWCEDVSEMEKLIEKKASEILT